MLAVNKSWSLGHYEVNALFNPNLRAAWLGNHALTLKSNTAKHHIGEKSSFFEHLSKNCQKSKKILVKFKTFLLSMP